MTGKMTRSLDYILLMKPDKRLKFEGESRAIMQNTWVEKMLIDDK